MHATWRWLTSAGLLGAGAALLGRTLAVMWQPCAGEPTSDGVFSAGCRSTMNGTDLIPLPAAGSTAVAVMPALAVLLLAGAWLVLLPTLQVSLSVRLVAAAPAVLSLALGARLVLGAPESPTWMPLGIDAAVALALLTLWGAGVEGLHWLRYALVLLAASIMSFFHQVAEYSIALGRSDATDTPPGTGWVTVVGVAAVALVTAAWCLVERRTGAPAGRVDLARPPARTRPA